jgi:hypothetical protein
MLPCVSSSRPFEQLPLKIINVEKPSNTRLATRDAQSRVPKYEIVVL